MSEQPLLHKIGKCTCAAHQQLGCAYFRMGYCAVKGNPLDSGNGAPEKIREYFDIEHSFPDSITETDYFLAWLWAEGFMVTRIPQDLQ